MAYGDRCLLVHGHFYQPPRENPWTGQIDPQYSAAPWENWNRRIADECYIPTARSRVYNRDGKLVDLYNNYAHTSFNFGPTLLSWLADVHPRLMRHLADAADIDRTFAMAQAYNHMMLPLADARDRHTQIVWGLREFRRRFGFHPAGMWLPECGIDPETTHALIDHGVRFVVLSPHQASRSRPFGSPGWRDVSMGAVDTRRSYRLFDIDGGGRTHFDRHLDVVFYTPGLNLKVSFDHILNRPDDLARELESCYMPGYPGAQLVSIVTDGEIYGHHEKHGEEALTRLFHDIAPRIGVKIVSAGEFVRDNPPEWEVKLWNGEDGRGSSWSCEHGMGRWYRDCGCRPPTPPGWNQRWRTPLRNAFDAVRDEVRRIARRELGGLIRDVDDARDGYIEILLDPTPETRAAFIRRHSRRALSLEEVEKLWRVLEALHNAMLMYTSCGWFFDELSGLEPVQNMRYALRAAELVQPFHDGDLAALLERELSRTESNLPQFGSGDRIFRQLVLPTRHSGRELAAAIAVCLAAGFPTDSVSLRLVERTETVNYSDNEQSHVSWGSFVCHDSRLDRFIKTSWVARLDDFENTGIGLYGYEEAQGDPFRTGDDCPLCPNPDFSWLREMGKNSRNLSRQELFNRFGEHGVGLDRLPEAVRGMVYRRFSGDKETELLEEASRLGARAVPFLSRARRHGARVPDSIVKTVTSAFEQEMMQSVCAAIAEMFFDDRAVAAFENPLSSAKELGLWPSRQAPEHALELAGMELLHWLSRLGDPDWLASRKIVDLPEGGQWLPPEAPINHGLRYPNADAASLALGKGLVKLRNVLVAESDSGTAGLLLIPLPELLDYADRLGFATPNASAMVIEFWDFLDKSLPGLVASDPVGMLSGPIGDRLRRAGSRLGFSETVLSERLLAAARPGAGT